MNLALAVEHLIPNARYNDASSYERLVKTWQDETPTPSEEELIQAWDAVVSERNSSEQKQIANEQKESQAKESVKVIPGWATWTEQELLDWISNNISSTQITAVNDLTSAKVILQRQSTAITAMGRMLLAMRDKIWPDLE